MWIAIDRTAGLRALAVAALSLMLSSCSMLPVTELAESVKSPDGALVADFYWMHTWAGGHDEAWVRLRVDEPFHLVTGTVFSVEDYSLGVQLKWIGDRQLQISYAPGLQVGRADTSWQNVAISYVVR